MLLVLLGVLVSGDRSGAARAADAISLDLPIRCELGRDCWIVNYVDMDPSAATHDYNCGGATYDGHEGTDFAIRDLRAMDEGVPVLAAAPGRVKGVRDSMDDAGVSTIGEKEALEGRLCGNRVAIVHGGGWVTNYCHLRRGSIVVADGEAVKAGQVLAMVGQSGFAAFPHLHLGVIKGKRDIDPFVGLAREDRCGLGTRPLWKPRLLERLQYRPTALFNAGFATTKPKWDAVKRGAYRDDVLSRKARVLVLWAVIFHVRTGDRLTLRITGPDGEEVLSHASRLQKDQASRFAFAGRKRKGLSWDAGTYTGEVRLIREGPHGREEFVTARTVVVR